MFILGRVVDDPTLRQASNGPFATFRVVSVRTRRKQDGSYEDIPEFHDCIAFGPLAEPIAATLFSGGRVFVEGELEGRRKAVGDTVYFNKTLLVRDWQAIDRRTDDSPNEPATRATP